MQTPAPTTSPSQEETANVPLPVEHPQDAPLDVSVFQRNGQVFLAFSKPLTAINMTPKVARKVIRELSKAALEADRNKPGR